MMFGPLSNEFTWKTKEQLSSFPPLSVQVWHAQMVLLDSTGTEWHPPFQWLVGSFLVSTKVDTTTT